MGFGSNYSKSIVLHQDSKFNILFHSRILPILNIETDQYFYKHYQAEKGLFLFKNFYKTDKFQVSNKVNIANQKTKSLNYDQIKNLKLLNWEAHIFLGKSSLKIKNFIIPGFKEDWRITGPPKFFEAPDQNLPFTRKFYQGDQLIFEDNLI